MLVAASRAWFFDRLQPGKGRVLPFAGPSRDWMERRRMGTAVRMGVYVRRMRNGCRLTAA